MILAKLTQSGFKQNLQKKVIDIHRQGDHFYPHIVDGKDNGDYPDFKNKLWCFEIHFICC
jgi:hypothetical protein